MPKVMAQLKLLAPHLNVDLHTSDELVDLQNSRWDMAIRVNSDQDVVDPSPIHIAGGHIVASREYLDKNGIPESIDDLANHQVLVRENSNNRTWRKLFKHAKPSFDQLENLTVLANTFAIKQAAIHGLGVAVLADFIAAEDIAQGLLVEVLRPQAETLRAEFCVARIDAPQLATYESLLRQAFAEIC